MDFGWLCFSVVAALRVTYREISYCVGWDKKSLVGFECMIFRYYLLSKISVGV